MTVHRSSPRVVCFGEALWDFLPRGLFLGGAPLNVAYHLSRHGLDAVPVSAVGRDALGDEALRRVTGWRVETRGIARVARRPTGVVRVTLDAQGLPHFDIERGAAWDAIPAPRKGRRELGPAAIVSGSLALRSRANRAVLEGLWRRWPDALRVCDLNLRPPYDRGPGVALALRRAQMLKLNDGELARLVDRPHLRPKELASAAAQVAAKHGIERVCVTAGAFGAGLWWDGKWLWEDGRPVHVEDTVGAGDAFLGALLGRILTGVKVSAALAQACRVAEFVAGQDGATPAYAADDF
ncbi:PfkB family carbohydrate kinase [Opitutus sp. ER46]|uniref:PfkB family carbohydrate kinase n=1 Tax=Opitutus sp. ER46 TaxID=2161864 RepID=UPI0013049818|nr:PfkB family carbohydrate kinase [Opitutus sp. ER46]